MSVNPADIQDLCDSLGKGLLDLNTTFSLNPTSVSPTATSIIQGLTTASPSTLGRIAGFDNVQEQLALLAAVNSSASQVATQIAGATQLQGWYANYVDAMDALETVCGSFGDYLVANDLLVNGFVAAAFNYYATVAAALGLRPASYVIQAVPATNTFVPLTQTLATLTIGGAFTAVAAVDSTQYMPAPLGIVVYPSGVPGSPPGSPVAEAQTISYIPSAGANPLTVTLTPTAACVTPGHIVSTGVSAVAVTGVSLGSSANDTGYTYSYIAQPNRSITTY